MASKEFSDFVSAEGDLSQGTSGKSQAPPPYAPASYGYDQPANRAYDNRNPTNYGYDEPANKVSDNRNPTNYGYDQPGDRDLYQPPAFRQPGYGYPQPATSSSHTNVIVTTGPSFLVAPVREEGPPPDTTCGLVMSILVTFFCGWPCGIGAIVANRRARAHVEAGQYANARSALSTMWIWVVISIMFGIGAWVYVGFRIKWSLDEAEKLNQLKYNNYNYNN